MAVDERQHAKLLAIDDDESTQKMLRRTLSKHFDIDVCANSKEFLDSTANKEYDIFLMDISLREEVDGCDLTRQLRQSEKHKTKPVIAFTAFQSNKERQRAFEAGIDLFLTKPVMPKDLIDVLEGYVK